MTLASLGRLICVALLLFEASQLSGAHSRIRDEPQKPLLTQPHALSATCGRRWRRGSRRGGRCARFFSPTPGPGLRGPAAPPGGSLVPPMAAAAPPARGPQPGAPVAVRGQPAGPAAIFRPPAPSPWGAPGEGRGALAHLAPPRGQPC